MSLSSTVTAARPESAAKNHPLVGFLTVKKRAKKRTYKMAAVTIANQQRMRSHLLVASGTLPFGTEARPKRMPKRKPPRQPNVSGHASL